MCRVKDKKRRVLFILNDKIKYYTKETAKFFKVTLFGLLIITAIILIKYKPMYEVTINNEKIGYISDEEIILAYINEQSEIKEKNIAFIDIENKPEMKLTLVSREEADISEKVKKQIEENTKIEYTTYAITYDGKNKAYVSSMEDAEKVVKEIKEDYSSKYTKKIGILQVYSDNYSKISSVSNKKATTTVSNVLKKLKQADDEKIRIAKQKANQVKIASSAVKVAKASNVNGIKFTVRPVSGRITSRFGYRSSPGGIGSTNHKGLDIAAPNGTPIYAAAAGTVEFSGYKGSLGKLVIINHGKGVKTYYAHCSSLKVSTGQKVEGGANIAAVGKTGTATGYHLHFEVRVNGASVNPQRYLY